MVIVCGVMADWTVASARRRKQIPGRLGPGPLQLAEKCQTVTAYLHEMEN